ncbi:MAG: trimethylamine methyltransferase family protein, partial [Armatimonadia bacterium]
MQLLTRCMSVLTDDEMAQVWRAALRVWAEVPLRAQGTEEFMQALRDFGCDIDGELVRFPSAVRDAVLARVEQSRSSRGPARPAEV